MLKKRRKLVVGVFLGLMLASVIMVKLSGMRLSDAVSPKYWIRKARGHDLYDPEKKILYRGNPSLKEIALTIDDGPHRPTGPAILDVLKREQIKATFYVVGLGIQQNPDLIQRMLAEGHEVANHSQNHRRLIDLSPSEVHREINDCDITFNRITGLHLRTMRPPGVRYNDEVLRIARDLGLVTVSWSSAARDYENVSPDFIVDRILSTTSNGSVLLLHDDWQATVTALPRIISTLKSQGYRFVTISEMLSHLDPPVVLESTKSKF